MGNRANRGDAAAKQNPKPKNTVNRRVHAALFFCVSCLPSNTGTGAALEWIGIPEGRSCAVRPESSPHDAAGFTRLVPSQTGVSFTNQLSEAAAAENQILLNGSGVALGDVDRDGRTDLYFCGLENENRLYRNLGGMRFADITASAGVSCAGQLSTGAAPAD